MEVVITADVAEHAADAIAEHLRPGAVLGLATGSTPLPVYAELLRRRDEESISFDGVRGFTLDEYLGLPRTHPQSYHAVIRRELTDAAGIAVDGPDGEAADVPAECARYEAAIAAAGGIDVQLLGIGSDGHIGFNEPGSSLASRTRVKTLTPRTRRDNARFFDSLDDVPVHVITQGLATILEAGHLVLVATGAAKAAAIAAAVEGPVSASCPASVLQLHPHATVFLDDAASSDLKNGDHYRFVADHKPEWQGW